MWSDLGRRAESACRVTIRTICIKFAERPISRGKVMREIRYSEVDFGLEAQLDNCQKSTKGLLRGFRGTRGGASGNLQASTSRRRHSPHGYLASLTDQDEAQCGGNVGVDNEVDDKAGKQEIALKNISTTPANQRDDRSQPLQSQSGSPVCMPGS